MPNQTAAPVAVKAEPWPEADAMFRSDPRWLGGDGAYSIHLGGERTLWLFGDSFVCDEAGPADRDACAFIHNTVAVQYGLDPSRARLEFAWGAGPSPLFAAPAGEWLWPLHGARLGPRLLLFFMRVRSTRPDLATVQDAWKSEGSVRFFDVFDWTARIVENPDDDPRTWRVLPVAVPPPHDRVIVGSNVAVSEGHLYAYGWRDGHSYRRGVVRRLAYRYADGRAVRRSFLLRWPLTEVESGRLDSPQWWAGPGRWSSGPEGAEPLPREAVTESTVHLDPARSLWCHVRTIERPRIIGRAEAFRWARTARRTHDMGPLRAWRSVGAALSLSWSASPDGEWSQLVPCFAPPESARRDVLVYAAKAHPELEGADLVLTYNTGSFRMTRTLADDGLYYPRFVRVTFAS